MKNHKVKKSLGQNFLKSQPAINKIIEVGELSDKDTVLEIGPGKGVLTEKLLKYAGKVIAIEKDRDLIDLLKDKFTKEIENKQLTLIEGDCLDFNPKDFSLETSKYKIIANIPYNITGAILKKFLENENQPERMVLMVQKEVAERIVAKDGKESILSISVKTYGEPKIIIKVPKRYFSPAPKVDSAVILIKNISKNTLFLNKIEEKKYWNLIKSGFAHKRKVLAGNLRELNKKIDWNSKLKEISLSEKTRAEELSLDNWINLYKNTQNLF